ncbi:hypothetical protein BN1110_03147 [bacterium YEK0313]|nr:hypothetical protein BN1110_03147 [bacterium YEK0313]
MTVPFAAPDLPPAAARSRGAQAGAADRLPAPSHTMPEAGADQPSAPRSAPAIS